MVGSEVGQSWRERILGNSVQMKTSDLIKFLHGNLDAKALQFRISKEVDEWVVLLAKRGSSAPISLLGPAESTTVTSTAIANLLDALLTSELTPAAFSYVVDAMLMSGSFSWPDNQVRDLVEGLVNVEDSPNVDLRAAVQARKVLRSWAV